MIRGGHSWLRLRISAREPLNDGDQVNALIALNQDTLDRHLQELSAGGAALYNSAKLRPNYQPPARVQFCPLPVPELTPAYRELPVMQNTVAVGAVIRLMGLVADPDSSCRVTDGTCERYTVTLSNRPSSNHLITRVVAANSRQQET